jgi:hypothetical protein
VFGSRGHVGDEPVIGLKDLDGRVYDAGNGILGAVEHFTCIVVRRGENDETTHVAENASESVI